MKWRTTDRTGRGPAVRHHVPAVATMPTLGRSTGAFYLLGGIGSLLPEGGVRLGGIQRFTIDGIGYLAIVVGVALLFTGSRWPRSTYHALVTGGTCLIAASVMLGKGTVSAQDPLILFALPLIAGAAFFSWRAAVLHGLIVVAAAILAMAYVAAYPTEILIFVSGLACIGSAVAWLARLNERVEEDPLTGLGNRRALARHIEEAVDRCSRGSGGLAVVMIDLDHFKTANDRGGHAAGDEVLVACAQRWRVLVPDERLLFRFGGDEFALLLPGHSLGEATQLAERLRAGMPNGTTASVGVATWEHGDSSSLLVGRADVALYEAKANGRDQTVVYGDPSHAAREIEEGLRNGEFVLHFQPVVSLVDGSLLGSEALVRWHHPKRGLLGPGEFVGVAERTGCIRELGSWTLEEACRVTASDPDRQAVSVNVSVTELREPCYAEMVRQTLARTGLHPRWLIIEVTEGVYDEHDQQATDTLGDLRSLGVLVALDDFGSGWSSLRWLTTFPVDILKIDGSFVHAIGEPGNKLEVLSAIVKLGKELCLQVLGEQVETEQQLQVLRELGCDSAQGYYIGRPQPLTVDDYPEPVPVTSTPGPRRSSRSGNGGEATVATPRTLTGGPTQTAFPSMRRNGRPKRTW